ncbi:Desmoglein-4 [Bienertia sinuspersici]
MDKEQLFEVGLNSDIVGATEKVEDNVKDEGIRRTSTESKEHEQNGEDEWGLGRRSAERNNQLIDKVKEESSVKEVQVDTKIRKKRSKKDKKNVEADDSRLEFESKIKMLEEELREAVALEIGLYSIVAEHLNSKRKVHAPAQRLSRPSKMPVNGFVPFELEVVIVVMEQFVDRLDVAMFNAILRDSDKDMPMDPMSDPISEHSDESKWYSSQSWIYHQDQQPKWGETTQYRPKLDCKLE